MEKNKQNKTKGRAVRVVQCVEFRSSLSKQTNSVRSPEKPVSISQTWSQLGEEFSANTAELNQSAKVQKELENMSLFSSKLQNK